MRVGSILPLVVLAACSSGGAAGAIDTPMLGSATDSNPASSSGDEEEDDEEQSDSDAMASTGEPPPPGCMNGVVEVGELCFFQPLYTEGFPGATWLASESFDGDSHADLAVAAPMQGAVYVLFGNGEGDFTYSNYYDVGIDGAVVATGSFDAWTLPDLITANRGDSSLSLLLNGGTGEFAGATSVGVYAVPSVIATADFNADGMSDVAVAHDDDMARVTILLGNDAGVAEVGTLTLTGGDAVGLTAADVDGDAIVDLVLGIETVNEVSVMKGDGAGGFIDSARLPSGGEYPIAVRTLDLDGDGTREIAVGHRFPGMVGVGNLQLIAFDGLNWTAGQLLLTEGAGALDFGDFDADSDPDIVLSTLEGGSLQVFLNDSSGTFDPGQSFPLDAGEPYGVIAADFDENGAWDIAAADRLGSRLALLMSEN